MEFIQTKQVMKQQIIDFAKRRFPTANGITINVIAQWIHFITMRVGLGDKVLQARYKTVSDMMRDDTEMVEMIFRETGFVRSIVFGGSYEIWETDFEPLSQHITISDKDSILGNGGYGVVFPCRYKGTDAVMKRYHKTNPKSGKVIAHDMWFSFFKEFALLKQLGTTQVFGCGWYEQSWVMVMEKHQIKSLDWKQHEMCNSQTMSDVISQLFAAVDYIHTEFGFIHGDVKPDNILIGILCDKPAVKLIDFGLAEPIRGKIRGHQYLQTIYWRAPELLSETMCDLVPTDIWATAVCALDIMLGSIVFMKMGVRADISDADMLKFIKTELASFPAIWETLYDGEMLELARTIYDKFLAYDPRQRQLLVEKPFKQMWV
jgi:serine/threonine protein kinase